MRMVEPMGFEPTTFPGSPGRVLPASGSALQNLEIRSSQEIPRPELLKAGVGQPAELAEESCVRPDEVETRLALHAAFQLGRHAFQQFRASIDRHQVKAYVALLDLHCAEEYRPAFEARGPRFQVVVARLVVLDAEAARVALENFLQGGEGGPEILAGCLRRSSLCRAGLFRSRHCRTSLKVTPGNDIQS